MISAAKFLEIQLVQPSDFSYDETLCTTQENKPKLLQELTTEERSCVSKKKILAITSKKTNWGRKPRRESEAWDADVSATEQSHSENGGKPPMQKTAVSTSSWLVMDGSAVCGPFTEKEMRNKVDKGELNGKMVKRDTDKIFVSQDILASDLGDFLSSDRLDRYYDERSEQDAQMPGCFDSDLAPMSLKTCPKKDPARVSVIDRCIRTKTFLHSKNPSIRLGYLENRVAGKSFADALGVVSNCTGMKADDSEMFLRMFLDESGLSVLSDVCPDGFVKAKPKKGRRG